MAKKQGVSGWHSMRKDQLVHALARLERSKLNRGGKNNDRKSNGRASKVVTASSAARRSPAAKGKTTASGDDKAVKKPIPRKPSTPSRRTPEPKPRDPRIIRRIQEAHAQRERYKDLSQRFQNGDETTAAIKKDRIVLMVRDPYWLHAYWELTNRTVERAQVALSQHWHSAKPTLRLLKIANANSADSSEEVIREIDIHGAVRNWYIDVHDPPSSFRTEIGYLTEHGSFHALARSNTVTTPQPGSAEMLDGNWAHIADNCEKIYAMSGGYDNNVRNGELQELFEERLRRPMGSPMVTRFGTGAEKAKEKDRRFCFDIDAEMIVYGITKPDAFVTMAGEPVKLRPDGSFTARVGLPERRQVIPVVASSSDGVEEQTIVLAVERNTKVMEPIVRDVAKNSKV